MSLLSASKVLALRLSFIFAFINNASRHILEHIHIQIYIPISKIAGLWVCAFKYWILLPNYSLYDGTNLNPSHIIINVNIYIKYEFNIFKILCILLFVTLIYVSKPVFLPINAQRVLETKYTTKACLVLFLHIWAALVPPSTPGMAWMQALLPAPMWQREQSEFSSRQFSGKLQGMAQSWPPDPIHLPSSASDQPKKSPPCPIRDCPLTQQCMVVLYAVSARKFFF